MKTNRSTLLAALAVSLAACGGDAKSPDVKCTERTVELDCAPRGMHFCLITLSDAMSVGDAGLEGVCVGCRMDPDCGGEPHHHCNPAMHTCYADPYCGDGQCNGADTRQNCAQDCPPQHVGDPCQYDACATIVSGACWPGGPNKCTTKCKAELDCVGNTFAGHCDVGGGLCVKCIQNADCLGGNICVQNVCKMPIPPDMALVPDTDCIKALIWYVQHISSQQRQLYDKLSQYQKQLMVDALICGEDFCNAGNGLRECARKVSAPTEYADNFQCTTCLGTQATRDHCGALAICLP